MSIPFLSDIILKKGNKIQFTTDAGANAGTIDTDSNGNLVFNNTAGDILLGDGSSDVFIGDGTNNVDIIFEQSGAIKGDGSSVTLTLGGANTTLNLENPNINGQLTLSNKLTFTGATGYILFDYEPSTGSNAEYTGEVPLLKVDHAGTEKTVLSRLTNNGALAIGIDDTVAIVAGDTKTVIKDNINYVNENVVFAAEGGFLAFGFPNNSTSWSNRNEFQFRSDSATASENGLYIGDGSRTQFIDLSRNLKNIASIRGSGNMPFLTDGGSALKIRARSAYFGGTYANDGASDGEVDAESGFRVGGTSVIDSSRNLANIGTIGSTGDVTITNGNVIFSSQYGVRFNDANTRIYTNTDTPEDLLVEADQDILLTPDGQVNVHSNLVLSNNSYVVSARKFTARDSNGVMLTADDAASGLSIEDNGNATFTGTVGSGSITSTGTVKGQRLQAEGSAFPQQFIIDTTSGGGNSRTMQVGMSGNSLYFKKSDDTGSVIFRNSNNTNLMTIGLTDNGQVTVLNELEAGSLDINGNADISGTLSGNFVVRSTNNANTDGANFAVDTTNKSTAEYAYEVLRSGTTVGGIRIDGRIEGTGGTITGNLSVTGTVDGVDISALPTSFAPTDADATPSWVPSSDPGYLTSSSTQSKYLRSDTADTATGKITLEGNSAAWNTTTPGTTTGSLHFDPGVGTDHFGNAITFGASDTSNGTTAQAGIYLRTDGSYGSRMYFATTDSYNTGSKVAMYINNNKDVYFLGGVNMSNNNISGVNAIQFADPGPSEGVTWTNTKIFESPNDLTTNTSGNLQLVYNNTRRLTVDSGGIDVNGNIVVSGTVDGVDVATLKTDFDNLSIPSISGLATLASPTFTGTPAAPTAAAGTNTTQIATTAFVSTAVSNLVGSAPEALDTLQELGDALGDDANFATTTATALGNRVRVDANQNLSDSQKTTARSNIGAGTSNFDGAWSSLSSKPTFVVNSALQSRSTTTPDTAGDGRGVTFNYLSNTANPAPTGTDHSLMTMAYSNAWQTQLAQDWREEGRIYVRGQENGTWSSWNQVWDSSDFSKANVLNSNVTLASLGAQASGNYITGSGSLSAQDLTDIGNLSGTNTGDQDLSGLLLNTTDTFAGVLTINTDTTPGLIVKNNSTSGKDASIVIRGARNAPSGGVNPAKLVLQSFDSDAGSGTNVTGGEFYMEATSLTGGDLSDFEVGIRYRKDGSLIDGFNIHDGTFTVNGNIAASNFSGSSSGTNTGDQTLSSLGAAAASHTHAAGDITSGTFNTSRISSASVTQHAADFTDFTLNELEVDSIEINDVTGTGAAITVKSDAAKALFIRNLAEDQDINFTINDGGNVATPIRIDAANKAVVTNVTSLHPQGNQSGDLGKSNLKWNNIYAATIHGDGSNLTNVSSTDSTKLPLSGGGALDGGTWNFDTNTNSDTVNISRTGSNSSQVMKIGITDTVAEFNYIEDTSSEGNGNFGQYIFKLGGNDGETTVSALNITKTGISAPNFSGSSSGTNTGDQDISGITTNATAISNNATAISNITSFPGFGTTSGTALEGNTSIPVDLTVDGAGTVHANNYDNTQLSNSEVIAAVVASTNISSEQKSTIRSNIGAGTSSFSGAYGDLTGKPTLLQIGTTSTTALAGNTTTISSAQSTKLGHISVTQAVDLDTIETRSNNGHTAYGWGDHADEGYLTSFDITTQTDSKYIRSNANDNVTAHTEWQDNKQARFGNDADMKIQHTGTHGYIDNNTGDLYIRNNVNADVGGDIYIRPHDTEHGIIIFDDNDVEIYHNNSKKFSTTSNGFECNGTEIDTSSNGGGYKIGFNVSDNFSFSGYNIAHYGISNAGNDTGGGIVLSGYFGIRFATNGSIRGHFSQGGTFTTSGDIVGFGSPSDISLKENIKPIDNALDKVCKLKGVTFDWKESDSILEIKEDIGFIAQDVQEVLPELIKENDNGKLSLRDKGIVPVLVEAIKELKAEIDELKKCNKCKNCNCND